MSPSKTSDLALRLLTAGVTAPLVIYLCFWGPRWGFPMAAAVACLLGAWELFGIVAVNQPWLRGWGIAATAGMFAVTTLPGTTPLVLPAVVALTCVGMLITLSKPLPVETASARMAWSIAGPLYMGALFGVVSLLSLHKHGGAWVMLSLMCGFFSDTAGYFVGRRMGKHPLSPLVSPKKTIEGSIAGLMGGLLGGLLAHFWYLQSLPLLNAIALSLVAAAAGQAGDLCESLIKRSVGVKDSGTILPGHGGILDRSDAMLFSAATVWGYVLLFAA
jgi:phosphatidate cytidylyltransferase